MKLKTAFLLLVVLTVITGFIYPWVITGFATVFFRDLANGSLILKENHVIGSKWIGQSFTDAGYFWGRPSATAPYPYNALASTGSNLGPTNPALVEAVRVNILQYQKSDLKNPSPIPLELICASASGLDPHISPESAKYQVSRVAKARKIPEDLLYELIDLKTEKRQFFILGEPRVNVLLLNLELDNRSLNSGKKT